VTGHPTGGNRTLIVTSTNARPRLPHFTDAAAGAPRGEWQDMTFRRRPPHLDQLSERFYQRGGSIEPKPTRTCETALDHGRDPINETVSNMDNQEGSPGAMVWAPGP
jgi:hypothetical protein